MGTCVVDEVRKPTSIGNRVLTMGPRRWVLLAARMGKFDVVQLLVEVAGHPEPARQEPPGTNGCAPASGEERMMDYFPRKKFSCPQDEGMKLQKWPPTDRWTEYEEGKVIKIAEWTRLQGLLSARHRTVGLG